MKFLTSAASVLLLASTTSASALGAQKLAAIKAARAARLGGQPFIGKGVVEEGVNGTAATVTSTNWSGAAVTGSGFTEVTGTFTIPTPSVPSGGSTRTEFCGAAWVGIDGFSNADLIQTGVLWCIQNGAFLYEAWYEYLPAALVEYTGITVTAGQSVTVTATKTGTNSGTTRLTAGGTTVTHTFTNQNSPIPGQSAEWIVEDFESGNSLVPFANFGHVTFSGASAITNGVTVTPGSDAATNIVLESSSGAVLTSTTISGSSVAVTYE